MRGNFIMKVNRGPAGGDINIDTGKDDKDKLG